jgi:predicted nucleic acid-binding protein
LSETFVIDASVAVEMCLAADGFGLLAGYTLVGPALLTSETLSALHEGTYRGDFSPELARAARARLHDAPIELLRPEGLAVAAWDIADALGWAKTYDAEYVALARLLGCALLTVDARLARGAGQFARIIGPADL